MIMNCICIIFTIPLFALKIDLTTFLIIYFNVLWDYLVNIRAIIRNILCSAALFTSGPGIAGEKVMVDKEEYESLKAAVQFLMGEREENKKQVEEAKQAAEDAAISAKVATENAEEATEVAEAAAEAAESPILEGLENVSIGGYGEVHYNNLDARESDRDVKEFDLHRFVLFFGYQFTDNLRFYSELEIEHGGVEADGDPLDGEVEVEQAFIEWDFAENTSALGGVFLIPTGIINETHEPDTFYGVERNAVENVIIPATWWEVGAMVTHRFDNGIKLEAAAHSGLEIAVFDDDGDPTGEARVRGGRQKASNADASHIAYTGSVTYTGIQGMEVGASLQLQDDVTQNGGDGLDDGLLWTGHIAYERGMYGLRALYAQWDFDGDCNGGTSATCIEIEDTDFDKQQGWYIEPSIKPLDKLGFFARYEDVEGGRSRDEFDQWTIGFNYWLHEHVVLKADYQDRDQDNDSDRDRDRDGYNLGIGWSF